MCGIYLFAENQFSDNTQSAAQDNVEYENKKRYPRVSQSFRGPSADRHLNVRDENITLDMHFDRLHIVGGSNGMQPFELDGVYLMANAEIYNYLELADRYGVSRDILRSDCDIILHLYKKIGIEAMVELLDGEFAFVIYDRGIVHLGRDRCGIKPLYYYHYKDEFACSSTIKAMHMTPQHLMPGTILSYNLRNPLNNSNGREYARSLQIYHVFKYFPGGRDVFSEKESDKSIYRALYDAVYKRINMHNNEVEVGFFLSGGLDSSAILALALEIYSYQGKLKADQSIKVFTFGFHRDAPDVVSASKVIEHLKTKYGNCIDWHLIICDISTGIDALEDTIYNIETYDTTTVRASVPMYIMSQYVAMKTNVKIILSGEGSDELFGGYLYFRYAPDEWSFRREILRLLSGIFLFDVQRAERCTAAVGLELRPPFLDAALISAVLSSPHLYPCKNNTKSLLRYVLATYNNGLLPESILYGKKEALSDAVGYDWRTSIKAHSEAALSKESIDDTKDRAAHIESPTDEQKYYQFLYKKYIGGAFYLLPHLWLPLWVDTKGEPSATVLDVYSK